MATPPKSVTEVLTKKQPEGIDLYARFALAGALGCSITHGGFTPVDV
jgi:solute carrier family 25 phosphate transporter 3